MVCASLQHQELGGGLEKTEKSLVEKRAELLAFEKEFKKARTEFEAVRLLPLLHICTTDRLMLGGPLVLYLTAMLSK
jgi:hypothetical protein